MNFTDPTGHRECKQACVGDVVNQQELQFASAYGGSWDPDQQAANAAMAETVLVDAPQSILGAFWEPADWGLALRDGVQWHDTIGMLPLVPATVGRYGDDVVSIAQRAIGGTGKAYDKLNGQGLYAILDTSGNVHYVGRGDAPARLLEHSRTPELSSLQQIELASNNLTVNEARGLEQLLIDHLGLENLMNKINGISPRNPNRENYLSAGRALFDEVLNILQGMGQ